MMNKFIAKMDFILKYIIVALALGMLFIIFVQIVTRYILNYPLSWSEELARYLMIWLTFLGTAVAVGKKGHIIIDFVIRYIPKKYQIYDDMVVSLITAMYLVIIIYSSYQIMPVIVGSITPTLQISYVYVYAAIPISSLITILYLVNNVIEDISKSSIRGR
jgi:TRAP-type C4-dicarboxylate transport system permease small subunit